MGIRPAITIAICVVLGAAATATACGPSAVGVDECRLLEDARCQRAQSCGIDLTDPVHRDGTDVASCVRFYDTACLHGLVTSTDPGAVAVKACVTAINDGPCTTVVHPETDPACAFLVPPVVVDSGTDTGVDAESDAADATAD